MAFIKLRNLLFNQEEDHKHYKLVRGHFSSPFAAHLPGLVPKESETAHFEMLIPKQWKWTNGEKPMVVHLAGTGDHVIIFFSFPFKICLVQSY